jgi:hypothetical protein
MINIRGGPPQILRPSENPGSFWGEATEANDDAAVIGFVAQASCNICQNQPAKVSLNNTSHAHPTLPTPPIASSISTYSKRLTLPSHECLIEVTRRQQPPSPMRR